MGSLPHLIAIEARVLGVLIEKSLTTPDQYPLTLNAATNGCNQKSNRDPVTSYLQAEVSVALQGLTQKHLAGRVLGSGSRVEKFRHTAHEGLGLDDARLAVMAELLMRGSQSPGELRARVHRMVPTPGLNDLLPLLETLRGQGFIERIPPGPGSRAEKYAQRLAPELRDDGGSTAPPASSAPATPSPQPQAAGSDDEDAGAVRDRVEMLEKRVEDLSAQLGDLIERLGN